MKLPDFLAGSYAGLQERIRQRLKEYTEVPVEKHFYELCFCICTPQSKARSAIQVQEKLEAHDFFIEGFDPTHILFTKEHYIRFHNAKAARLLAIRKRWTEIEAVLNSSADAKEKRYWLAENINGIGMKESAHFLRNIGYRGLGILDRHILKHLVSCGVYNEIPKIGTRKAYEETELAFARFAQATGIDMDELDLLFWAYETGEVLK